MHSGDCFINNTISNTSIPESICRLCPQIIPYEAIAYVYLTLAIVGFLTNGLALYDLWRAEKTTTVTFVVNIVASDLMLCCSLPFRVAYYWHSAQWAQESSMCTLAKFTTISLFYINLYCNMLFLLWTSVNRYVSVVRPKLPLLRLFKRARVCRLLCAFTWVAAIVVIIGTISRNIAKNKTVAANCFDHIVNANRHRYNTTHVIGVTVFFLILVLMLAFYALLVYHLHLIQRSSLVGRGQRGSLKVRRKILASVVLFVACFLPYHLERILLLTSDTGDCRWQETQYKVKNCTILLAALSCCLHPLLHLALRSRCCRARAETHGRAANSCTDAGHTVTHANISLSAILDAPPGEGWDSRGHQPDRGGGQLAGCLAP
uniref:Si:dkey-216e24.9 n=1 Tax=Lepisosteus oculatus TaxID=7918 RepID=W5M228_LEPOC|nr:PREDICTED: cysteinyl leukotriene receptor 1-like [Lepisosteus oculatus]